MRPIRNAPLGVECLEGRLAPAADLLSVNTAGTDAGDGRSQIVADVSQTTRDSSRAVSADGRYVLFQSFATDVIPGPVNGGGVLYVRDTVANTTTAVSVSVDGVGRGAGDASISADGRFVVFEGDPATGAAALVPGFEGGPGAGGQLYIRDLAAGTTALVSVRPDGKGGMGAGAGYNATVSDDGRFVVFRYVSDDLVGGDANGTNDIFIRDTVAGTTTLVSHTPAGGVGNGDSADGVLAGGGDTVLFRSRATDLTATPDANGAYDLFAYSVADGTVTVVSVNAAGAATGDKGVAPQYRLDGTGTKVVFVSSSTDLTADAGVVDAQLFARDLTAGTTRLLSVRPDGNPLTGTILQPAVSDDGGFATFATNSSLSPVPSPNSTQVYLVELATGRLVLASRTPAGTGAAGISTLPVLSGDGRYVVFQSDGADLVPGVTLGANAANSKQTLFAYDRLAGTTVPVSTNAAGDQTLSTGSSSGNTRFAVSRDGTTVVFTGDQTGYGPADANGALDVYAAEIPNVPILPLAVGASDGSVRIVNAATGLPIGTEIRPFDADGVPYTGIVSVALGDLTGDGKPDLFVAAASPAGEAGLDPGKAGKVFVYDGATLGSGAAAIHVFTPFATTDGPFGNTAAYTNGLNIAVGDMDGDGAVNLVAGTRGGSATAGTREYGRLVVVVPGTDADGSDDSFLGGVVKPFGNGYEKGVVVAAGDLDNNPDNRDEVAVTRGGPVASTNPNRTVKLKAYRFDGDNLAELDLSGSGSAFAPFAGVSGAGGAVIERDARVAFVDPDGDGKALLVFSAIDRLTDPNNPQVRVAAFDVNTGTGLATAASTGTGPNGSYLVGQQVVDHAITRVDVNRDGASDLALITEEVEGSGILFLDPLSGAELPGGIPLSVLNGGVTIDGF